MAQILKDWDQNNKMKPFDEINELLCKQQLSKIWFWRIFFILLSLICFGDYYLNFSPYYKYSLYGIYLFTPLVVISLFYPVTELEEYHQHYVKQEEKITAEKQEKFKQQLQQILTADTFKVLNNIYLPCSDKWLYQVDAIIISKRNIYVLEFTEWSGVMEGMVDLDYWRNQDQKKIKNPYQTNQSNVDIIKDIVYDKIPNEKINFYNLVVNLERDFNYNIPDRASYPIFDNLYESLYWIKRQEQDVIEEQLSQNEQQLIAKSIKAEHFSALEVAELSLNKQLLENYGIYQQIKKMV
ncbi:MAG: nuclease-related domain-containing protein [Bacillota bacterium]